MTIRFATLADVPAMRAIYAPYVSHSSVSFEYRVPTAAEFAARFEKITADYPWLVAVEDGTVLGYAYASRMFARAAYDWDVDMSIYVAKAAQGKGLGRALYAALEQRLEAQGFCNLFALITEDNAASIAFHAHMGYEQVGCMPRVGYKFGRWHGVVWMMKRLRDPSALGPAPVRPVEASNC